MDSKHTKFNGSTKAKKKKTKTREYRPCRKLTPEEYARLTNPRDAA